MLLPYWAGIGRVKTNCESIKPQKKLPLFGSQGQAAGASLVYTSGMGQTRWLFGRLQILLNEELGVCIAFRAFTNPGKHVFLQNRELLAHGAA